MMIPAVVGAILITQRAALYCIHEQLSPLLPGGGQSNVQGRANTRAI